MSVLLGSHTERGKDHREISFGFSFSTISPASAHCSPAFLQHPRPHPSGMPDPEPHEAAAGQKDNHLLITLLSPLCSLWESRASSLRSQACLPPAPLLSPVALAPVIGTWEGRVVREGSLWGSYLCWVLQPSLRQRDAHTVSVSDRDLMSSLHLLVPSLLTLRNVRRKGRGPHARTPL